MSQRMRRLLSVLLIIALFGGPVGCGSEKRHDKTYYTWFDTVTTVIGYGSEKDFDHACAILEDVLERYHRAADIYHEYSGMVNACSVNRAAGRGPVAAAPELAELLAFGREVHALTHGQCSVAMGAVLSIWHDCREAALAGETARVPEAEELREAWEHCRIEDLVLDDENGTVELRDPEMRLDLGAVAKGYAAEKAARALENAGFTGYALNLGGNVRTLGAKPGGGELGRRGAGAGCRRRERLPAAGDPGRGGAGHQRQLSALLRGRRGALSPYHLPRFSLSPKRVPLRHHPGRRLGSGRRPLHRRVQHGTGGWV